MNLNEKKVYKKQYLIKIIICFCLFFFHLLNFIYIYYFPKNIHKNKIRSFLKYIKDCKNLKRYNRIKIKKENPYISICIPALNMEKYIEQTILSIINQSFQDFEIIIINDNSKDETKNIIKKMQLEDNRVKLVNHDIQKGCYYSRIEAILKAKGNYIMLMDPDDLYLNENLFQELYQYNLKYNLDIIEFTVFFKFEGNKNIFFPPKHYDSHFHNFSDNIINQTNLSEILFKEPNNDSYTHTICRNIWNKMIRKKIFFNAYEFIGLEYLNNFVITADDMALNAIIYHFANNYSNINLPGYMYNIRPLSMSRGDGDNKLNKIRSINYLLYFKILYRYIKKFELNRKILFHELKDLQIYLYYIKNKSMTYYENITIYFLNEILDDNFTDKIFKSFSFKLLSYFKKKKKFVNKNSQKNWK